MWAFSGSGPRVRGPCTRAKTGPPRGSETQVRTGITRRLFAPILFLIRVLCCRFGRSLGGGASAGLLAAPGVRQLQVRRQPGRALPAPLQAAAQPGPSV